MTPQAHDIYPVSVQTPETSYPKARVVVTAQGRAVIWTLVDRKPARVEDVTGATAVRADKILTVTTEGGEWACVKNGSCGCGDRISRLRMRELLA